MHKFSEAIGIEPFPGPRASDPTVHTRAIQTSHFMHKVQQWYVEALGLTRIATDPYPLDDPEDIPWRIGRLAAAGPVEETGLQFIGAFERTPSGRISRAKTAMVGLLALRKETLCAPESPQPHTPTEILEWDAFGHPGLGRALLAEGMRHVHPSDRVFADVVETNDNALAIYNHYGFRQDTGTEPMRHGIFDVNHTRLQTSAYELQQHLGVTAIVTKL